MFSFSFEFKRVHLLYLVTFLAAFLLFQIELIISKIFLPKFGGSYLVWGSCVVFFQCVLLLGYFYSHIVVKNIGLFKYRYLHLILIALPLLFFPGRALPEFIANNNISIVFDIFLQLFISIGVVFFALSTISVITQSWLSFSDLPQQTNPFVLYSVSNAGSFLALITYPFIFEWLFDLREQLFIWRSAYLVFLLFYLSAFLLIKINRNLEARHDSTFEINITSSRLAFSNKAYQGIFWFLLSAAGSVIFLSVTNIITYEIAPCPLLWIMPLCIYLLSFVFTFKEKAFCPDWIKNYLNLHLGFAILLFFLTQMRIFPRLIEIAAYGLILFVLCMYCQYQLFTSRPEEKSRLTSFYLIISFGGVVGSMLVTWLAPLVFVNTSEFLFGLFMVTLAMARKEKNPENKFLQYRLIVYTALLLVIWPLYFEHYNVFGIIIIAVIFRWIFANLKAARMLCACLLTVLVISLFPLKYWMPSEGDSVYSSRNFYGIYRLYKTENMLVLLNGTTLHGVQYLDKKKANEPLSYYHKDTTIGKFFNSNLFNAKAIGVIGLGTGTLAAYGKEGQEMDFFELDRDVYNIADSYFTFLKNSPAKINHIFGDARVSLRTIPLDRYDLIIVDAFSGDSVPIHLLTVEAIKEYRKHLTPKGVILFHVSNRYFDLEPILFSNAKMLNAYAVLTSNKTVKDRVSLASQWVALTWDVNSKDKLVQKLQWKEENKKFQIRKIRPWTDGYSNVLSVMDFRVFTEPVKHFKPFYW